jgi:hypothetical protein
MPKCQVITRSNCVLFVVALNTGLWVASPIGESIQGKMDNDVKQPNSESIRAYSMTYLLLEFTEVS